jgi:hypothetical protein
LTLVISFPIGTSKAFDLLGRSSIPLNRGECAVFLLIIL